jgi:hypothetical protein
MIAKHSTENDEELGGRLLEKKIDSLGILKD